SSVHRQVHEHRISGADGSPGLELLKVKEASVGNGVELVDYARYMFLDDGSLDPPLAHLCNTGFEPGAFCDQEDVVRVSRMEISPLQPEGETEVSAEPLEQIREVWVDLFGVDRRHDRAGSKRQLRPPGHSNRQERPVGLQNAVKRVDH